MRVCVPGLPFSRSKPQTTHAHIPPPQIVLCGAGMDARAYRLPELVGRRVFELDVKPVLEYKAGVLAEVSVCMVWVCVGGRQLSC